VAASTKQLVLIVEDETDLVLALEYNFQEAGFETISTTLGGEGKTIARTRTPDVVLLDLMLPDMSGNEVCKSLKTDPRTAKIPIIIITAKGSEPERVIGFELGADDYVVKPFSVRELVLRVRAVLRRNDSEAPRPGLVNFGMLRVDRATHRAFVDNAEVSLTALEFRLLLEFLDGHDRVHSRAELLGNVWGADVHVEPRTVDQHIKRLREKLGAAGEYIHTVRGVGYRLASSADGIE
jgi:two-component system phosphate regulon response regulator PhoB